MHILLYTNTSCILNQFACTSDYKPDIRCQMVVKVTGGGQLGLNTIREIKCVQERD